MSYQSKRFCFDTARPEDGAELLEILESQSFSGQIQLLYTRRPDPYASFHLEGDPVDLVVCRDRQESRLAGLGACAHHALYVNGTPRPVGYLLGLRARPEYMRTAPVLHHGYAALYQSHRQAPDFYLTSILEDNRYAQQLLEKKRPFMPVYEPFLSYQVFAMATTRRAARRRRPGVRRATPADLPRLVEFLQQEGRRQQFFPLVTGTSLGRPPFPDLRIEDFLLWEERGELQAVAGMWDQRRYKQYHLQGYGGALRWLQPFSFFLPLLGWPALPRAGTVLHFFTLALWAVRENQAGRFASFLNEVAYAGREFPFFLVGLPVTHPFYPVLADRRHIGYRSRIYIVYWPEQEAAAAAVDRNRSAYLECGLL